MREGADEQEKYVGTKCTYLENKHEGKTKNDHKLQLRAMTCSMWQRVTHLVYATHYMQNVD